MTYDYASPAWSDPDVTGHNAPLKDPDRSSVYSVEANIMQWIAAGASPAKMTLGVAHATVLSYAGHLTSKRHSYA